jgi:hypothetical protein
VADWEPALLRSAADHWFEDTEMAAPLRDAGLLAIETLPAG